MTPGLTHYLVVSGLLFALGVFGAFTRRNAIALLMSFELILLAVALNFAAGSRFLGDGGGQVFAVFVVTVAAAEAAVGLALIIAVARRRPDIDIEHLDLMKG